jgi:hypothetical protein
MQPATLATRENRFLNVRLNDRNQGSDPSRIANWRLGEDRLERE